MRVLFILGVLFLLFSPGTMGGMEGSWLQSGYDAAATGAPDGVGPVVDDRAFSLRLPGVVPDGSDLTFLLGVPSQPVILDRNIYIPVQSEEEGGERGIAQVDLDTAESRYLIETEQVPRHISSNGENLFVTRQGGVDAYDIGSGEPVWTASRPQSFGCLAPVIHQQVVLAPCMDDASTDVEDTGVRVPFPLSEAGGTLVALNATTGEELWVQEVFHATDTSRLVDDLDDLEEQSQSPLASSGSSFLLGVTHTGSYVFAVTVEPAQISFCDLFGGTAASSCWSHHETTFTVWALDPDEQGRLLWMDRHGPVQQTSVSNEATDRSEDFYDDPFPPFSSRVTDGDGVVYTKFGGTLRAISPSESGPEPVWEAPLGQEEIDVRQECDFSLPCWIGVDTSPAFGNGALYTSSNQLLHRFDIDAREIAWRTPVEATEHLAKGPLILAGGILYAMATAQEDARFSAVYALDAETGDRLWRHEIQGPTSRDPLATGNGVSYAMAEGVVVAADLDGWIHVIGRTNASLGAPALEEHRYVPVEEAVDLNVPEPEPGAFGPATQYKVEWGDGTTADWQEEPEFSHTYEEEGEVSVRVIVGNDANQTASTFVTFHVGQEAPTELNFLQKVFARENQDLTFGVFGLLLAVSGGAIGVARQQRKKHRLKDALDGVERAFAETKSQPLECEAQLTERKAHARGLMLDGQLGEDQFKVVTDRIEELRAELRIATVREEFAFLPHNVARALEEMLQDGRVATMEHEGALAALENAEGLTPEYRDKVRTRINEWYNRDRGEQGE